MTTTFPQGQFWKIVLRRATRARAHGALQPIETEAIELCDGGLPFIVRVAVNLARKAAERQAAPTGHPRPNPFLPYDPDLFVCDISPSHLCLLNKFNVVDHHLLVVTRHYEHQEDLLTFADFTALWTCFAEVEGLAFYNSGAEAGASQTHKHLQIVPLPWARENPVFPFAPLFDQEEMIRFGKLKALPFGHVIAPMATTAENEPLVLAEKTQALYGLLLDASGIAPIDVHQAVRASKPYNVLITREWVMLVPRSRENFETISINALALTGSLFVKTRQELQRLTEFGPASVLREVGVPC